MFPCPGVQEIPDSTKRHIRTHSSTMSIHFSMLVLLSGKKGIHTYNRKLLSSAPDSVYENHTTWYMTILQHIPTTCLFSNQTLFRTYSTLEKQLNKCMCISWYPMVTLQYKPFITKSINCTYTFFKLPFPIYSGIYNMNNASPRIYRCYVTWIPSVYTINVGNT